MITNHTEHLTTNEFADNLATAKPGDRWTYAQGDLAHSAVGPGAEELKGVRALAYRAFEDKRGFLTQRRRPDITFKGGAAFEYVFTVGGTS
jgi:hypothetical protein